MSQTATLTHADAAPAFDTRIGYVVIESAQIERWRTFARDALGIHVDEIEGGGLGLRLDDHLRRILIRPGPAEDVVALGWEVDDPDVAGAVLARAEDGGLPLTWGGAAETAARGVEAFAGFPGPKGLMQEVYSRAQRTNRPLQIRGAGFVAGDCGIGHVALTTRRPEAVTAFFQTYLGARLTDRITDRLAGLEMAFTFLHMNPRHHSVAIAATEGVRLDPIAKRVQHLMVEARELADVGDAYARCKALGFRITMGMGQHPNDGQVSFYVETPSGFEMEVGWNPILITDEAAWRPSTYRGISKWGHRPEGQQRGKLGLLAAALASLFRG
jgi:2,3-dihydroxybiphenyl 1,2-dioxygenase